MTPLVLLWSSGRKLWYPYGQIIVSCRCAYRPEQQDLFLFLQNKPKTELLCLNTGCHCVCKSHKLTASKSCGHVLLTWRQMMAWTDVRVVLFKWKQQENGKTTVQAWRWSAGLWVSFLFNSCFIRWRKCLFILQNNLCGCVCYFSFYYYFFSGRVQPVFFRYKIEVLMFKLFQSLCWDFFPHKNVPFDCQPASWMKTFHNFCLSTGLFI